MEVDHWACLALLRNQVEGRDVRILCHLSIVSTEGRSNVYDTSTIFCCDVIAKDDTESLALHLHKLVTTIFTGKHLLWVSSCVIVHKLRRIIARLFNRLYPWHELLIVQTLKFCTHQTAYDTIRNVLVATLVGW